MEDRVESLPVDSTSAEQQHNTEGDGCSFSALFKRRSKKNFGNDDSGDDEPIVQKDGITTVSAATTYTENDEPSEKNLETLQVPV